MTLPSLRIVIVNWNTGDQLRDCLRSLANTNRTAFFLSAVVVIDNASADGSADGLDEIDIPLKLIRNDKNRGFGAACNQGAADGSEDYILFLNPDTRAFADSLDAPLRFMTSPESDGTGICGIRMVDVDGHAQMNCSALPSPGEMIAASFGLHILTGGRLGGRFLRDMDYACSQAVEQVIGAFFLVRRGLFEQLEGFDERFFVYFEEVDFAKRAAELGYGSYFVAEAALFHLGQGSTEQALGKRLFYVTVPTPVDENNQPDLAPLQAACAAIAPQISGGATIVFESTVFPGATEEVCGPALEAHSGLKAGQDFFLGYSPERINPGDRQHTVDRIMKIVSGQTDEVTDRLAALYGAITSGGIFRAKSIKVAEAAKVIENSQRDINIAFVNEIAMIFGRMGLSVHDVLDAAGTKWNFLDFTPGLVGGHCISVDPFYLAHKARAVGYEPQVILAGRRTNDGMGLYVAESISSHLEKDRRVLVLGLTFKENVPDLRNSKVIDVIRGLEEAGLQVDVHDPLADKQEARALYGVDLLDSVPYSTTGEERYDCIVGAVAHDPYQEFASEDFRRLLVKGGLLADIKGIWRETDLPADLRRWQI